MRHIPAERPRTAPMAAPPPKEAVMSLVERGGKVRSFHVPEVTATTLKPIIVDAIAKDYHSERTRAASIGASANNSPVIRRSFTRSENSAGRCPYTDRGGLLLDLQARHLWRLSPCQSAAFKAVSWGVRFSLQRARSRSASPMRERAAKAIEGAAGKRLTYRPGWWSGTGAASELVRLRQFLLLLNRS